MIEFPLKLEFFFANLTTSDNYKLFTATESTEYSKVITDMFYNTNNKDPDYLSTYYLIHNDLSGENLIRKGN